MTTDDDPTTEGLELTILLPCLNEAETIETCVDKAISSLKANGTIKRLQQLWLAKATGAPVLK